MKSSASEKSRKITVSLWDGKDIKESYTLEKKYSDEEYEKETKEFVAKWCNKRKLLYEDQLTITLYAEGNENLSLSTLYVCIPELYKELCRYLEALDKRK